MKQHIKGICLFLQSHTIRPPVLLFSQAYLITYIEARNYVLLIQDLRSNPGAHRRQPRYNLRKGDRKSLIPASTVPLLVQTTCGLLDRIIAVRTNGRGTPATDTRMALQPQSALQTLILVLMISKLAGMPLKISLTVGLNLPILPLMRDLLLLTIN